MKISDLIEKKKSLGVAEEMMSERSSYEAKLIISSDSEA